MPEILLSWVQYTVLRNLIAVVEEGQSQNMRTGEAFSDEGQIEWDADGVKFEIDGEK